MLVASIAVDRPGKLPALQWAEYQSCLAYVKTCTSAALQLVTRMRAGCRAFLVLMLRQ